MLTTLIGITYVLVGVCAYAGIANARIGMQRNSDKTSLSFSLLCLVGVVYGALNHDVQAGVTEGLETALAVRLLVSGLVSSGLLLLVTRYTKTANSKVLVALYSLGVLEVLAGLVAFSRPRVFSPDVHLRTTQFLNEVYLVPVGSVTKTYLVLKISTLLTDLAALAYLSGRFWDKRDKASGALVIALLVYLAGFILDSMAYQGYLEIPFVGPLFLLSALALISFTLDYENILTNWRGAYFDGLTGLPNRERIYGILEDVVTSGRSSALVALLFIDLDRFKEVNDALGHHVGDKLLIEASIRMKACVRTTDCVGRLGGDEFVVVLYNIAHAEDASLVAMNILKVLSDTFVLGTDVAHVSASIGITVHPKDAVDIPTLFKNADQAMYEAKKGGRNRYCFYDHTMQEVSLKRALLINDLHNALVNKEFFLQYQPITNLTTGVVNKAEALVRWNHPRLGMISPAEFIPIAEDTGIILALGEWIFTEAGKQLAAWRRVSPDFKMSVNVSAVQFRAFDKHQLKIQDMLDRHGLPGDSLIIEITESTIMVNDEPVAEKLNSLQAGGIEIALDDFGTGYSSLAYLKKFPIDYIKIDQSFVRTLHEGSSDMSVCEAITVMAHKLGLQVIAEGVETKLQCELLQDIGCDFGQGYYFSRPTDAADFPLSDIL